jgi:hypothetical protein
MWLRLDDRYPRHPKVAQAGVLAGWLDVCGMAYCAEYLTDGFIPESVVPALADFSGVPGAPSVADLIERLLAVKRWERAEGGYRVHDYLDYNPSRQQRLKQLEAERAGKHAGGRARAQGATRDAAGRFADPAEAPAPPQQPAGAAAGDATSSPASSNSSSPGGEEVAASSSSSPAPSPSPSEKKKGKKAERLDGAPPDWKASMAADAATVIEAFEAAHLKALGKPYVVHHGRDRKALQPVLQKYPVAEVLACIEPYFADRKSIEKLGARIPLFANMVPVLAARPGKHAREQGDSRPDLAARWKQRWKADEEPS